jgi:hypothetical protein
MNEIRPASLSSLLSLSQRLYISNCNELLHFWKTFEVQPQGDEVTANASEFGFKYCTLRGIEMPELFLGLQHLVGNS